jgi:hypothetical protein
VGPNPKTICYEASLWLACVLLYLSSPSMANNHQNPLGGIFMINVKGILIPVNWDKKGNVVSVAIATDDEKEYLVADQELTESLKSRLRQVVQVSGVVKKAQGKSIIKVKQWRCQNEQEHKKTFNWSFDF